MPTKIEWTDETWNPVTGCTKVSPGCAHCYAERMARRLAGRYGYPEAPHHFDVTLHRDKLFAPLHWKKPRQVFVCSMSDLFHEDVEMNWQVDIFAVMALTQRHTYQVLTKRPSRMRDVLSDGMGFWSRVTKRAIDMAVQNGLEVRWDKMKIPLVRHGLPNVWLGITVEDQQRVDERIPHLLDAPAVIRFLSVEPMLGLVDISPHLEDSEGREAQGAGWTNSGLLSPQDERGQRTKRERAIHLVIVGGETGPGARPMHPDWVRLLRDQCQEASVSFFFKAWGAWRPIGQGEIRYTDGEQRTQTLLDDDTLVTRVGKKAAGRLLDGREWNEKPL
ncbi:DUF5131 family protein [Candidatus Uhrbacteria bacterium]|nr:DUF5131 family protein [Candidatus Uhrbacteria bacterium]